MPDTLIKKRFRSYLPVVVDVETGGFDNKTHAILEIAATFVDFDSNGFLVPTDSIDYKIRPADNTSIDDAAAAFLGLDLTAHNESAISEPEAFRDVFKAIRDKQKQADAKRAILVGHNATFDLGFIYQGAERAGVKRNPFHPFSVFDTVSLGAMAYGHTVLAELCKRAEIPFDKGLAHSAAYDAEKTAQLYCKIYNLWQDKYPWSFD